MVAGHVSGIDNLKGSDGATDIGVGAGVDRISHPDIGYHHFGTVGASDGLRGDGNHGRDI